MRPAAAPDSSGGARWVLTTGTPPRRWLGASPTPSSSVSQSCSKLPSARSKSAQTGQHFECCRACFRPSADSCCSQCSLGGRESGSDGSGDAGRPLADLAPVPEAPLGDAQGRHDRPLREAELACGPACRRKCDARASVAAKRSATSTGSSSGLGGSPTGPLENSHTGRPVRAPACLSALIAAEIVPEDPTPESTPGEQRSVVLLFLALTAGLTVWAVVIARRQFRERPPPPAPTRAGEYGREAPAGLAPADQA